MNELMKQVSDFDLNYLREKSAVSFLAYIPDMKVL
jgi:hypothetical protein